MTTDQIVTFAPLDRVVRNEGEYATVTYVSEDGKYLELKYDNGYAFRALASEWHCAYGAACGNEGCPG